MKNPAVVKESTVKYLTITDISTFSISSATNIYNPMDKIATITKDVKILTFKYPSQIFRKYKSDPNSVVSPTRRGSRAINKFATTEQWEDSNLVVCLTKY